MLHNVGAAHAAVPGSNGMAAVFSNGLYISYHCALLYCQYISDGTAAAAVW
jgi:hypothetical protein